MEVNALRIHITGIVQGVGFRPFIYGLAKRLELNGWVRNTSAGVDIEIEGSPQGLEEFKYALTDELPPLARIDELDIQPLAVNGYTTFEIIHSERIPDAFQPISPDVSICTDCLREMFDPADRRYRYPFINCTNCGPRFTIIRDIPYDRPNTTMAGFPLCPDCAQEYNDPLDRRFHAQPVACPVCGPQIWLEYPASGSVDIDQPSPTTRRDAALHAVQDLLLQGRIAAIKGLGGFHLACDALNSQAVAELRTRKLRVDKPFALMMPDIQTVRQHCSVSQDEQLLLESRQRPIVILKRRPDSPISQQVAPQQDTLGVMLPYTPLHYLLFNRDGASDAASSNRQTEQPALSVLVMTSGNLSEEPIAYTNQEARRRLGGLADVFMMHDREIHTRCDDSVMRVTPGSSAGGDGGIKSSKPRVPATRQTMLPLRRARGYAPYPIRLKWESPPLLAAGTELKNTFCLTRDAYAFLSQHIGDMENYETLQAFEQGIAHYEQLFRITPQAVTYDLHPNYLATRYALNRAETDGIPALGVQHHHAHIAACMAENGLSGETPVIGISFDGTGYGTDGAIWGGEFLLCDYQGFSRAAHLAYMPLPGGDAAIKKPARTALAFLWQTGLPWESELAPVQALCAEERTALRSQLVHGINSPFTSSMGRLFDAAASLAGVRQRVNYEAQAAIEFEALVDDQEIGAYPFEIGTALDVKHQPLPISPAPVLQALLEDVHTGLSSAAIAARFHNGVAQMTADVCQELRAVHGINDVVLSGGVWQNITLLEKTLQLLSRAGFNLYTHHLVPPNDGGVSLGQAAIAAHTVNRSQPKTISLEAV